MQTPSPLAHSDKITNLMIVVTLQKKKKKKKKKKISQESTSDVSRYKTGQNIVRKYVSYMLDSLVNR